jgi:GNAT superfamily N-acetyltransferase
MLDARPGETALRPARPEDAAGCARLLQDWLDATPWMPDLHDLDATRRWMAGHLFPATAVTLAVRQGRLAGYLALRPDGEIASLTVAAGARSRGVGACLLASAKAGAPGGLSARTFQANAGARRFYARHGFVETRWTDGTDNEEGLPDVLCLWRPA